MGFMTGMEYLELLARNASIAEFEGPIVSARDAGAAGLSLAELERAKHLALQVRSMLEDRRRRGSELSALFETAKDLAALNDLDDVLTAIVHRARQLLQSDMSYLSLIDEDRGDTYMQTTDGSVSAEFQQVRLPFGAGLGGLVAQTATPYASASYFEDERFNHTTGIDSAVKDEGLVSILGVPLVLGSEVIGVLYAANRSVRPFSSDDVALLLSMAAHAAIAIDNARLLRETQKTLTELESASKLLQQHSTAVERAANAHDRLTEVVLNGGGVDEVVHEVREVLGGEIVVVDPEGNILACTEVSESVGSAEAETLALAAATNRSVEGPGLCATPVVAGTDHLGVLMLRRDEALDEADRRILERAALVTALLLIFSRSVTEAESRVRGEFLQDLLTGANRDPETLRERARFLGADLDRPHAVVAADFTGDRARATQAASHLAATHHGFYATHRGRLVLVLPDIEPGAAARLVREQIGRTLDEPPTAGAAGPARGADGIVAAHEEAQRVVNGLCALGRFGETAESDDLGFVGLLLGDRRDVGPFVDSVLGPVLTYDAKRGTSLMETLEAYFRSGGNLARTKLDLHVHVNTVTQRLERIGRLLGSEWQEPERRLELQLALRLHRLLSPAGD